MTFEEFQQSATRVADLRTHPEIAAQMDADTPVSGYVYDEDLFIEFDIDGNGRERYCLTLFASSVSGYDLAAFERQLYDFAVSEGYVAPDQTDDDFERSYGPHAR